jgi:hypothetical protein
VQQAWVAPLGAGTFGPGTALASSTALTDISPAPQITLGGNFLNYAGARMRLKAFGSFSTSGTPTLLVGFYYGGVAGVALAASGATTTGSGASSWPWNADLLLEVRTTGTSGSVMCAGAVNLGTSLTAFQGVPIPAAALATVSVDTTTAKALTVGAQWGTSSASNTITCQVLDIESIY